MIDYSPFWETLEASDESWYTLTKKHRVSDSTLHRLKHNMDMIHERLMNDLCRILDCRIEDIAVYVPSDKGSGSVMVRGLRPAASGKRLCQ
ncbi:MAG: helix-turn-helix domain-containing protein [Enterocloster sp.]